MLLRVFTCFAVHPAPRSAYPHFRADTDRLEAMAAEGADVRGPKLMLLRAFKLYAGNHEGTVM